MDFDIRKFQITTKSHPAISNTKIIYIVYKVNLITIFKRKDNFEKCHSNNF